MKMQPTAGLTRASAMSVKMMELVFNMMNCILQIVNFVLKTGGAEDFCEKSTTFQSQQSSPFNRKPSPSNQAPPMTARNPSF